MRLQVINGISKQEIDFMSIYYRMFVKSVEKVYADEIPRTNRDALKQIVFSGMRFISYLSDNDDRASLEDKLTFSSAIKHFMSLLTPKEFEEVFPIDKTYDGEKCGVKDYFYTKEYLNGLDQEKPIGEDIDELLWEYHNIRITLFVVNNMSVISKLGRSQTGKSLIEELFPDMKTYTMHEMPNGKKVITDNQTGETTEVKKQRPRYLKPVN